MWAGYYLEGILAFDPYRGHLCLNKMGEINKEKYQNAILYFVKYCNNQYLGATKLNKLLYYLDFIAYRDRQKSITGDLYVHKQYGPVPAEVDEVLTAMKAKGTLEVQKIDYKGGETFKYSSDKDPNLSAFDDYEKGLLEKVCQEFNLWPTEKMVNQTHLEAPWFYSKPFEVVDYKYSKDIEFFANA